MLDRENEQLQGLHKLKKNYSKEMDLCILKFINIGGNGEKIKTCKYR